MKYKVSDLAKDFGKSAKEISAILHKYTGETYPSGKALEDHELALVFERLTQDHPVTIDAIFAETPKKEAPKAEAPAAKPAAQQAQGGNRPQQGGNRPQQGQGNRPAPAAQPAAPVQNAAPKTNLAPKGYEVMSMDDFDEEEE